MIKAILILKFFGWVAITITMMCSVVGFFYLIPQLDKDEASWFFKPLKILDELGT